jgi:hypothetical protein
MIRFWVGEQVAMGIGGELTAEARRTRRWRGRQETGDRRQKTGDRRQKTEDRRQKIGDRRQKTGDRS